MINKIFDKILIKNINIKNDLYLYSFSNKNSVLEFNHHKLYTPILLERIKLNSYRLVWGSEQIQALKNNKVLYADSFILDGSSMLDCFVYAVLYGQLYARLNVIEKYNILNKLTNTFKLSQEEIVNVYLPLIKENPSIKLLKLFLSLNNLSANIKTYLLNYNIPLSLAYEFSCFSIKEQDYIYTIINELNLSNSKVRLMMDNIKYLSKRDNKIPYDVLDSLSSIIFDSQSVNIRQKAFFDKLSIMRYPLYTKEINKIKEHIKDLSLPPRFKIKIDKHLEDESINVYVKIKNMDDYLIMVEKLNDLIKNNKIKKLFNLI